MSIIKCHIKEILHTKITFMPLTTQLILSCYFSIKHIKRINSEEIQCCKAPKLPNPLYPSLRYQSFRLTSHYDLVMNDTRALKMTDASMWVVLCCETLHHQNINCYRSLTKSKVYKEIVRTNTVCMSPRG